MRPGQQNKRMRGRGRKSSNGFNRVYESNGPDVKVRGTAAHIAEKYVTLARDAQSSGDPVAGEAYLQHAEHYFRIIAAMQGQVQAQQPYGHDDDEDGDDDQPRMNGGQQNGFSGPSSQAQRGQSDQSEERDEQSEPQDAQQEQTSGETAPRRQSRGRSERNQDKAPADEGGRGPRGPRRRRRPGRDQANEMDGPAQEAESGGKTGDAMPADAVATPASEPVQAQPSTEPAA